MRKYYLIVFLTALVLSGCEMIVVLDATATAPASPTDIPDEATVEEEASTPEAAVATMVPAPAGWLTYEDAEHGFYFHYPPEFEVLTDAENLYGWENGVALLYNGGQSYDIAIQVWDSSAEMEAVYGRGDARMHVFEQGGQLISVMNLTNEADSEGIITSFSVR